MPTVLDVFKGDGFSVADLSAAILVAPYSPGRLAADFPFRGIATTTVQIERYNGKIALIQNKPRGDGAVAHTPEVRDLTPFNLAHLKYADGLLADDVQDVRAFGDTGLQPYQVRLNQVLSSMRQDHEVTHEHMRAGAIQGIVYDADGTTELINLFTAFGDTRTTVDFTFTVATTEIKLACMDVRRAIEDALGAQTHSGIVGQCGDDFWDALITHATVKDAYNRWQDGRFLRSDQRVDVAQFEFANIMFENYRGKVGDRNFVPTDKCQFYPTGVPDFFAHYGGPADYVETVNTIGQVIYAKQERMAFDRGITIETQSNPAMICSRPLALVEGDSV